MPENEEKSRIRAAMGAIAVVDDDPSFREALVAALLSLGYLALGFETPDAFLAGIEQVRPALVVMDFDLPGMSGLAIYERLLSDGLAIPTVFVTANARPGVRSKIMEAGALACLDKPVSIDDLDRLILSEGMRRI